MKELEKTEAVVVEAKACLMKFSSDSIMAIEVAVVDAVATKVDKLKANEVEPTMRRLRESLALPEGQPLQFSATKNIGIRELWLLLQNECS